MRYNYINNFYDYGNGIGYGDTNFTTVNRIISVTWSGLFNVGDQGSDSILSVIKVKNISIGVCYYKSDRKDEMTTG